MLEKGWGKRSGHFLSFNSFPFPVHRWLPLFRWLLPVLALLALGLAGCSDRDRITTTTEIDEPFYREGQALLKTGRRQEALNAFLKVIDKRGEDAAESHLEVGLLYAQHINDPLSAIYHFKKYLALRPNSQQASLVRQRIDSATRDFARTLPAQPLENQLQRVDLVATLDKLKQENERLKQELADVKASRVPLAAVGSEAVAPVAGEPEPASAPKVNFSVERIPTVRTRPPATTTVPSATRPAATPSVTPATKAAKQATPTPAPAPTGRKHTVRPGDTLSSISQQYFKTKAKWRDILAANKGVLRSENDLKVGMELRIP